MFSISERLIRPPRTRRAGLMRWIVISGAALTLLVAFLGINSGTSQAQFVGDTAILLASLTAAVSCARAARRRGPEARAWWFMSLAALTWSTGKAIWTFYGITRDHDYPFPSLADAAFIGYSIPAAAALFSFPRSKMSGLSNLRAVLDASVIAGAVLFISWATVLGPIAISESESYLARVTGLAYPVFDIVMASLVLVLTMRRAPGERLRWFCLGGGLLVLAVTDSAYVRLTFEGVTGVTGSPLTAGWISAFLLMALAPMVRHLPSARSDRRVYALALELLPYILVAGAIVASATRVGERREPFLVLTGFTVLVLVVIRQVLIVFENVTLTRDLESKVAQRTAELEGLGAIVNSSADAIVGKTREGVITSWNPGAERIYRYPASEVIGKPSDFLIPDHLRDMEEAVLEAAARDGETHTYETERVRGDGSLVAVSLTMSPLRGDSGIHGVATIAQDITERRLAEAELVAAREAALESSRLKSEFLATMSHEIRTPMNGVIGLTALLLDTPLDETQRQYAEGVKGAGDALLSLINDILDFSKLEAGKIDLDIDSFDPRLLVEGVAGLLAEPAQAKGLELIAYCGPEVPRQLVGDAGRIRQVLLNLASNAVKFTPTGEVAIRANVVSEKAGKADVRFEVRDTGIGIDAADHVRLFESFSQADASTTRRYGGTGLGLAICQRLTEAMGGQIGLTSAPGQGSTFWFKIPLPVADSVAADKPAPELLSGLRVLVVDDNATNRLVLESQLSGWTMRPESVEGAPQALERLQSAAAAGRPYDIAVLDMCMPHMNGLELAREISSSEALKSTRIIMLTSTMQVDRAEMSAAGVREWLTKPVRSSEFFDRLMRLMADTAAVAKAPARPQIAQPEPANEELPSRGRILVVEDNEVNQLVARSMVAKLGYRVDVVSDGSQAVSATAAAAYQAVLMDCHMPVMDGFEATRTIRGRGGRAASLPIIAMTAGAMDEDRERCLAAGMDDYLTKPLVIGRLDEALNHWVPAEDQRNGDPPPLDPTRLAILRDLGPADGQGLLPAAVEAFRQELGPNLDAIRNALDNGRGTLHAAAHKLRGALANIGASRAAAICSELEKLGRTPDVGGPPDSRRAPDRGRTPDDGGAALLSRLEDELDRVDKALDNALSTSP